MGNLWKTYVDNFESRYTEARCFFNPLECHMVAEFNLGKWKVLPADNCIVSGKLKVKLEPKAMDLLLVLAKANGEVVSRDEIFDLVWKNQIIADHVLYNLIANLRKALEVDPHKASYISTVPKKGYRLLQTVQWHNEVKDKPIASVKPKPKPKLKLKLPILVGFIVAGAISIFLWSKNIPTENSYSADGSFTISPAVTPSIAVLPFDVFNSDIDTQYFADGLAEEIIHQLTAISDLAVISRTSSFAFRDKQLDAKTLATKLDVEYLIEGSVRQDQEQMRITVQLIKARQGVHLWSKVFTGGSQDIFNLQQDISLSIANSLLPNFDPISTNKLRQHPRSEEAYLHFLRGRAMAAKATPPFQKKAILEFEQAIALEPNYALAHVAIAVNTLVLLQYRQLPREFALERAQNAIDKALEFDPYMAQAYAAQGLLYTYSYQYNDAETAFQTAINFDPSTALAHHNYGFLLWIQDYQSKALSHFQIALKLNPMSAITNFTVADSLYRTGQLEQSLQQYQHCIALLPDYPACHLGLANFYRFTGQQTLVAEQFNIAKQQLHPQNIYVVTAEIIDLFWSGHFQQALSEQHKIQLTVGGGYLELQLKTLMYLQNNQQDSWTKELTDLNQKWPLNYPVQLAIALNAYFNNDCKKAIAYYEPILSHNYLLHGKYNVMAWGISHISNLAHCYGQLGQVDKKRDMLKILKQQIKNFDLGDFSAPGADLIRYKMQILEQGNNSEIQQPIIEAPVIKWLQTADPIFEHNKQ